MRIVVVDPLSTRQEHAAWNSTVLSSLLTLDSVDLDVILDRDQFEHEYFKPLLQHPRVHHRPIAPRLGRGHSGRLVTLTHLLRSYLQLFSATRESKPDVVLVLAADNTFTPLLLCAVRALAWSGPLRTFVFIHSNLEQLEHSPLKHRMWQVCLRMSNTTAILLAPFLEPLILAAMPGIQTAMVPNPTYGHLHKASRSGQALKHDFLFVGRHAHEAEASGFLAAFIQSCSRTALTGERQITIAIPSGIKATSPDENVVLHSYDRPGNSHDYLNTVASARFAVVPDRRATPLKTSGILADFLTVGTPFIAPKIGVWTWQSAPANHALLYADQTDIDRVVRAAVTIPESEYSALRTSTKQCGANYGIHATAQTLLDVIGVRPTSG